MFAHAVVPPRITARARARCPEGTSRLTVDQQTRPDSMVKDKQREEPCHGPPRTELPTALLCLIQANP